MNVVPHHSERQLQQLVDREPRADRAKRLRTVLMARQGFTAPEVAICTRFSPRSVQEWVASGAIETTPRRRSVAG